MKIDWPTTTWPGEIPQEGAGRLINAMPEKMGDGIKYVRSPGVQRYYTSPETGFRGMGFIANQLFVAYKNRLYYTTSLSSAQLTLVPDNGPLNASGLAGTGPVFFAANLKSPTPDTVAVAPNDNGAFIITQTTQVSYSTVDADIPADTVDICFGMGFFFFAAASGKCVASALNDTAIDPVNFTSASSKPDGLSRCIFFQNQLYLCGPDSIEVWGLPINPTGFPLNQVTVIPRGIVGARAVTGYENGIDLGLVFISGNCQVMRLEGYQPARISQPDLERLIFRTADKSTIEMTSFISGAHMYLKVKAPTFCWIYDFTTQTWHERNSWLSVTSRLKQAVYAAWFGSPVWIVGDESSGDLGRVLGNVYDEFGAPLVWQMYSKPVEPFPYRAVVGPAHFNFVPGQGSETHYQVGIVGASQASQCIITTNGVHALSNGMAISISGAGGMININSPSLMVGTTPAVTPTTFPLADANNNPINSTAFPAYTSGGTVQRTTIPARQHSPQVEISWSDDGGLNYRPPEIRNLGDQAHSLVLIRVFLTGSISVYGRVWSIRIADPVYISFQGADMPRISRREAA